MFLEDHVDTGGSDSNLVMGRPNRGGTVKVGTHGPYNTNWDGHQTTVTELRLGTEDNAISLRKSGSGADDGVFRPTPNKEVQLGTADFKFGDAFVNRVSEGTNRWNNHNPVSGAQSIDLSTTGSFISMYINGDITVTFSNEIKGSYVVFYIENSDSSSHTVTSGSTVITIPPSDSKLLEVWQFENLVVARES